MSYQVDPDGNVTFRCQGKDCGKSKAAKSTKVLPKKWCITGILLNVASPEDIEGADIAKSDNERILEANQNLSGHFCSFKCAKKTFEDPRVVAMVKKLKVAVVVYGDCKMVIDAEGDDEGGGRSSKPAPRRGGSHDDDPSPKGLDNPGSPPPFTLGEGQGGF